MDVVISIALSAIAILFLPALRLLYNAGKKQQAIEDSQQQMIDQMQKLVADKDRVHMEIITTIREDRQATDRRLRWLEENIWKGRR